MNMKRFKIVFQSIIVLALMFSIMPGYSKASEQEKSSDSEFNLIVQSDNFVVYEIKEDEKTLRYEENIVENGNKTDINTKIFDVTNEDRILVDEMNTSMEFDNSDEKVKIIQEKDSQTETEIISLSPEDRNSASIPNKDDSKNMFGIAASWTSSAIPGINIGYRYPDDAKYAGMYKYNVKIPNRNYDNFTRQVDAMKSRESGILKEGTGIAAVETLVDLAKGNLSPSWSTAWKLIKRVGAPFAVGYQAFQWFLAYDKAVDYFYATPPKTTPGTM
jgi:hypothetical protein